MKKITYWFKVFKKKQINKYLTSVNSEKLETYSQKKLIKSLQRVYYKIPAYNNLLKDRKVDIKTIKTINDFKAQIPVVDKFSIFEKHNIHELCINGSIKQVKNIMSSSGFSGNYSFGVDSGKNIKRLTNTIDTSLDLLFNTSKLKTLFINCEPMGVKIFTNLPLADTSVRFDTTLAIIQKFSMYYEQVILLGDPYFLKQLIEEGVKIGIDWKKINTSIVTGGDWFPESLRIYLEKLLSIEFNNEKYGKIIGTMGITELELNLFQETQDTIAIRKECLHNSKLKNDLFGEECNTPPLLFHYFPHRYFLEAIPNSDGDNELIFSILNKKSIMPLIRYNSKDSGDIYSYKYISQTLQNHNMENLIPKYKLPLVAIKGRANQYILEGIDKIYPNNIKQILFENFEIAASITGHFRLSSENGIGKIEIQLNKNISFNKNIETLIIEKLKNHLPPETKIKLYKYAKYPYGMVLDYERKFKFI